MPETPRLGIFSYSYHLALGQQGARKPAKAEVSTWLLDRVKALKLDGIQLHANECDESTIEQYVTKEKGYLEIAMGTWDKDSLCAHLSLAARLGARALRAFLVFDPLAWQRFNDDRPMLMVQLEEAASLAEASGMPLAIENHSDYSAGQIAQLVGDLASDYVGICFDSGNPPSSLEDPVEAARVAAPYVIQTHLRDFRLIHTDYGLRYEGVPLGDGVVDVREILQILQGECALDALTIESAVRADPTRCAEDNLQYEQEGARRSVAYARTLLGL